MISELLYQTTCVDTETILMLILYLKTILIFAFINCIDVEERSLYCRSRGLNFTNLWNLGLKSVKTMKHLHLTLFIPNWSDPYTNIYASVLFFPSSSSSSSSLSPMVHSKLVSPLHKYYASVLFFPSSTFSSSYSSSSSSPSFIIHISYSSLSFSS